MQHKISTHLEGLAILQIRFRHVTFVFNVPVMFGEYFGGRFGYTEQPPNVLRYAATYKPGSFQQARLTRAPYVPNLNKIAMREIPSL